MHKPFLLTAHVLRPLAVALLATFAPSSAFAGFISTWNASSGLTPDQISPAYTLNDTATPEDPVLSATFLTLSTSPDSELMYYVQTDPTVDTSGDFFIEARVRRVNGSSQTNNRAPISIGFTSGPSVGSALFIGNDEVFFTTTGDVKGPTASVDTNDAFHTYRIEVSGSGSISLFYDGNLTLIANTWNSPGNHGATERIFWGEATLLASGTSEWMFVRHNALVVDPVPEPSSLLLALGGVATMIGVRRRRR